MKEKTKKRQRLWLIMVIVVCMGIIVIGGIYYVSSLRDSLTEQSVQNVLTVTKQQQQAFDTFISGDRDQLRSFADYLSKHSHKSPEEIQQMLTLFTDVDAIYSVLCLDEGWFCSNTTSEIRQLDEESMEVYHSLDGSGIRESFIGQFSGNPRFGYYETFIFADGHNGLIQKSYDRTKVSETYSLSFYNDQGLSYVVKQDGEILMRPSSITENFYDTIFDALTSSHGQEEKIEHFKHALENHEEGSILFSQDSGELVYTYVPMETVEGWFLISVVSESAIRAEADKILQSSQTALAFLSLILVICGVFILLIWRTHQEIRDKDQKVEYQTQLFNIFTTYLSSNTNDMYMLLDHETDELEYVSPNVERVLGVPPEKILEAIEASDMSSDPEGSKEYFKKIYALKPGESGPSRMTERINLRNGERKFFRESVYCALLQGRSKRVVYISDRTKERKAQENLSETLRMAQAANDAKSAFLSSVSHDIRTPMNAITGFLALMRNEANNPGMVMEYTQRIDAASQHLLGLINDVLDMNKIESGSATLNLCEMNLAEVIDEINTIIRPQTKIKRQNFEIFVSRLAHEHLMGDKLRINQVLINLLSNAVKYTPEGGEIQMMVEELPQVLEKYSRIRFTVSDNGLGMSEDYLKVIFDPFTREETEKTYQIQGTGLGMAITKSLVDLMGGSIHVDSKPGEGSTFVVELELYIQEMEDDPKFWQDHNVAKMIVADDDEEVCENIVKIMSKTGVLVEYSTDGETAIQMMREARESGHPYDLILLDWKMPNLDGLETARLIRKNYPDKIPILLLTAYDWGEIEQEAMEIGIDHFMPKPFFMSTLKEAIRRVMGSLKKEADQENSNVVKGKHILVVDDIEVNRIILVKILTTLGARCDTASNGQEAFETFERSQPGEYDIILMDVQMPVMGGYAATRAIRASGHPSAKEVPIIAMTANAFVEDVRDAIDAGMDAHIAKPVQLDKLKSTIQQVLDSKKIQEGSIEQ